MEISVVDVMSRLAIAAGLSGLIGLERQTANKAAGLRTHMLVGLGAALFTVLSLEMFAPDTGRVAAGVVTGVGFLGAGAIFKEGASVRGLTTAAGLWAVAAIGMAAGTGTLVVAAAATGVALVVLLGLRASAQWAANRFGRRGTMIEVSLSDAAAFDPMWSLANRIDPQLADLTFERDTSAGGVARFTVDGNKAGTLVSLLETIDGITSAGQIR